MIIKAKNKPCHMNRKILLVFFMIFQAMFSWSQYSIVIKDGHVIDPKNNIDAVMDVSIADGKIVAVAKNIDASKATQVVNAKGLYVTPGLVDIHTHDFAGTHADQYLMDGTSALPPD